MQLLQRLRLSAVHSGIASHAVVPGLQAQEVAQLAINARESARACTKRLEAARYSSSTVTHSCSPAMYVMRHQREFLWEGRGPTHSMEGLYGLTYDLCGQTKAMQLLVQVKSLHQELCSCHYLCMHWVAVRSSTCAWPELRHRSFNR